MSIPNPPSIPHPSVTKPQPDAASSERRGPHGDPRGPGGPDRSLARVSVDITPPEWASRKLFVGFGAEDETVLRELRPVAEAYVSEIVDKLYEQFFAFEETRAFFSDETKLNRVKLMQKEYFLGLTRGAYGEEYLRNRLEIGRVHQIIGLSPRWYLGAYSLYKQLMFPRVLSAYLPDIEKGQRAFLALLKLITLDMELAITTYITASQDVISRQAQEILEISTPVVQIFEGVVVAPLIGSLDSRRTQQFMERLLERIVETDSPMALIDITGVPTIDTQTAQHLAETISAVQLLGAQVVLTGVRPAIAQTLVHLGVRLSGVETRSSLSAGLRLALETLNLQIVDKRSGA